MIENIQTSIILGTIYTAIIVLTTFIAFCFLIKEKVNYTLPEQIELSCKKCKSNNLSFHTQKINPKTKTHEITKFNLIILTIGIVVNIITFIIVLLNTEAMIDYILDKENFLKNTTDIIRTITTFVKMIELHFIILVINIIIDIIASGIKKDAVITICKDCGKVTSYFNENIN